MLDTGNTVVIFDQSLAHVLGEPKRITTLKTLTGKEHMELFDPPDAFLGSINLRGGGVVGCKDLSVFQALYGYDVRGVIGMSVLRSYVVQIDFTKSTVIIMTSDERAHPEWGVAVPIRYNKAGIPEVVALLPSDIEVRMRIDTGANGEGRLERDVFRRFCGEQHITTEDYTSISLGAVTGGASVIIPEFHLGTHIYHGLSFAESSDSALCLAFLSRHYVTFDFPNMKMYLKKADRLAKYDKPCVSGLVLRRESDCVIVRAVANNSPAEKAGIEAGDVIVRIGETNTNVLELWEVGRLLIAPHEENVQLIIRRGKQVLETSVLLERGL